MSHKSWQRYTTIPLSRSQSNLGCSKASAAGDSSTGFMEPSRKIDSCPTKRLQPNSFARFRSEKYGFHATVIPRTSVSGSPTGTRPPSSPNPSTSPPTGRTRESRLPSCSPPG